LSPQAPIKIKVRGSNNVIWKDFIYCTFDRCFKVELCNFWWPERTPNLQYS